MQKQLCSVLLVLVLLANGFMVGAQQTIETFEQGEWANQPVGEPLTNDASLQIEGWTLDKGDNSGKSIRLVPDPYNEGGTSLHIGRPASSWVSGSTMATKVFDPITNSATVGFRMTTPQTFDGRGHYFAVYSSDAKRVVNVGFGTANNAVAGKDWIGRDLSIGQWGASFGLYFSTGSLPNGTAIDALTKSQDGRLSYVQLEKVNLKYFIWEERFVQFVFRFQTKEIDVYYDVEPINEQSPVVTVPFADVTANDIAKITFGGNSGAYKGLYYDDILIADDGDTPIVITDYVLSNAVYENGAGTVTVFADVKKGSHSSANVFAVAYDAQGILTGMSKLKLTDKDVSFEETFDVLQPADRVLLFVWDGFTLMTPLGEMQEAVQRVAPSPSPSPTATPFPQDGVLLNETFDAGAWTSYETDKALNKPMIFGADKEKEYARGADTIIEGWALQGQDYTGSNFLLQQDPTGGTGQGLLVNMSSNPNYRLSGMAATKEVDAVSGVVEVSCRFVTHSSDTNTGRNHYLRLSDGNRPIVTFGGGYCGETVNTLDWNGNPMTLGRWNNYFGLYYATSFPGTEKDLNKYELVDGKMPYINLGGRTPGLTRYLKMVLDFDRKTIDVYYSSEPITQQTAVLATVPFMDETALALTKLTIGGGSYARGTLYWDDIVVLGAQQ